MYILRVTRLLIIVTLATFLTLMVTGSVSYAAMGSIAGIGVPLLLLASGLTNHYEDKRKAQELKAKMPWYADKQELTEREKLRERQALGISTLNEIRELEARLQDSEDQRRALLLTLEEKAFLRKYPVGKGTPAEQLGQISREYGLPVTTPVGTHKRALPMVQGAGHVCDGGFYAAERFCPKHGYLGDVSPDTSKAAKPAPKPEPEYVPEGYNGMLAALLTNIYAWAQDAQEHGGEYEWHMNDAWAKDVAAIPLNLDPEKNVNVIGQFQPGVLFGYHVVTGAQFGAPELVAV